MSEKPLKLDIDALTRPLSNEEIEYRVAMVKKQSNGNVGVSLLAYKNARVDMARLDEAFGVLGWSRYHEIIDGECLCTITVQSTTTERSVSKSDFGDKKDAFGMKGSASDAFKRAGFNFGIGRGLYTMPFIWIQLNEGEYFTKANGDVSASNGFRPNDWDWDITWQNGQAVAVHAYDNRNKQERFKWRK